MTINEFIDQLNAMGVTGDEALCVHAFGGIGGSGIEVTGIGKGFDWNRGKLMLSTKQQLQLFRQKEQEQADAET